ncbi:MAG: hypothetical protein IKA36_02565, partial [Clostridia bacterium]|nr:hypothetical protein [Clostridia bacterium]
MSGKKEKSWVSGNEDNEVIRFINRFYDINNNSLDDQEVLRRQFRAGYCYYFAVMLKTAFNRGEICWCAPFGHMCWVDTDGTPYDCEGVYDGEAVYLIPEHYLGESIKDFMHTDEVYDISRDEVMNTINKYRADRSISDDTD